MNRLLIPTTVCILALSLAGCNQAPPPAPDTRAADEKALRDGEAAWDKDWASKDVSKIMSHYADDAALLMPGSPVVKGRDAINTALMEMVKDPNLSLTFAPSSVDVARSGDVAYTQGAYTITMTDPKTKKVVSEKGKYLTAYKKQADGSWKATADMNNADAEPMPVK
jgi:uncharacterized protein (TIGR02246 family)